MIEMSCGDYFKTAEFHSTHVTSSAVSDSIDLPQAAFMGRSNAGKSTLINTLLNRKSLVKVSSTPGKTRTINLFLVGKKFVFADLPGFGYAKVAKTERKKMFEMVQDYINHVKELRLVFVLCDSARPLPPEEGELVSFCYTTGKTPVLLWTKTDHLDKDGRARLKRESHRIREQFPNLNVLHVSSRKRQGITEIQKLICEVLLEKEVN